MPNHRTTVARRRAKVRRWLVRYPRLGRIVRLVFGWWVLRGVFGLEENKDER